MIDPNLLAVILKYLIKIPKEQLTNRRLSEWLEQLYGLRYINTSGDSVNHDIFAEAEFENEA